jgi:integrase
LASKQSTTRVRLTKTVVEALPEGTAWDSDLKGFGVRVSDRGTRTYFVHGRMPNGRQVKTSIGRHGTTTCEQARSRAKALLGQVSSGQDPAAQKRQARQAERERRAAPDVAALCDRYLAEYVEIHNKPSTGGENRRMVERIIKPRLGRLKVASINRGDGLKLHRELAGTPRQANHVVSILSKMMNFAEDLELRPVGSNPFRRVKRYPEKARDRYLSAAELERLGSVLREVEAAGTVDPMVAACIRFLVLTGVRIGEAVGLEWAHVDFEQSVLRLPDAKAGARVVPLDAPALALLAALDRAGKVRVFEPVTVGKVEKAWIGRRVHEQGRVKERPGIRDRAGIPDVRIHDLRHTTGTYAGSAGLNAFMVRDLLGHKTMAMTGRYVSRHVDPLRAAADVVSGQIAAALEGKPAEVVPLRRGERA